MDREVDMALSEIDTQELAAVGRALARVVRVFRQHGVRMFGAAQAAVVVGQAHIEHLQALLQSRLQQGALAFGEVCHGAISGNRCGP